MPPPEGAKPIAVLIDGDNVSPQVIAKVLSEAQKYGTVCLRRLYGDFTSIGTAWKAHTLAYSIIPIQHFAYTTGKNSTDIAMVVDAMDLLHSGYYSAFCIVSNDSDFTRLAARIREQGVAVYGFGTRHAAATLRAACTLFHFVENIPDPTTLRLQSNHEPARIPQGSADPSGPQELKPSQSQPQLQHPRANAPQPEEVPKQTEAPQQPQVQQPRIQLPKRPQPRAQTERIQTRSQAQAAQLQSHQPAKQPAVAHSVKVPPSPFATYRPVQPSTFLIPTRQPLDQNAISCIAAAVTASLDRVQQYALLEDVRQALSNAAPRVTASNFGYANLQDFISASGIVDVNTNYQGGSVAVSFKDCYVADGTVWSEINNPRGTKRQRTE